MIKAIGIIRTSTEKQEIESQKKELLDFIMSDGIIEDEIVFVGEAGASAIKLDEKYMKNLNKVYELIDSNNTIECVYAWAVDRIGRNEEVLFGLKNRLISKGINLKIANPYTCLLNLDGTVNTGMELALSLFATMAKQEMQQKQARFKRAKERNKANGKWNGGSQLPYGYSIDKNGYYCVNEEEAKIVRLIFSMYATGEYSFMTLAKELNSRGYSINGKPISDGWLNQKINKDYYCGRGNKPAIIEETLFDKASKIREKKTNPKFSIARTIHLCSGLIYCGECKDKYVYSDGWYRCINKGYRRNKVCKSSITVRATIIERLVWENAVKFYVGETRVGRPQIIKDYEKEIEITQMKIDTTKNEFQSIKDKEDRAKDLYIEGSIDKTKYNKTMVKLANQLGELRSILNGHREDLKALQDKIMAINEEDPTKDLEAFTDEDKRNLILRYFRRVIIIKNGHNVEIKMLCNYLDDRITRYVHLLYTPYQRNKDKPNVFKYVRSREKEYDLKPIGYYKP